MKLEPSLARRKGVPSCQCYCKVSSMRDGVEMCINDKKTTTTNIMLSVDVSGLASSDCKSLCNLTDVPEEPT